MESLNYKVALITGSSHGIGAAIAKLFAKQGAKVVFHIRDEAALSRVEDETRRSGGEAMHVRADVSMFADNRLMDA